MAVRVDGRSLTRAGVVAVARARAPAVLAPAAARAMRRSRAVVERHVRQGRLEYGITTGLGELKNVHIAPEEAAALQVNLLRSHACGTGPPVADDVVRAMLVLRANALARGVSGVRPIIAERLLELANAGIHPEVPTQGSVGSSGDLVPLAHMALPLIGEGRVRVAGRAGPAAPAMARAGISPVTLGPKEGLALVNGTQFQAAHACLLLDDADRVLKTAQVVAAMTLESLMGSTAPFDEGLAAARPHPGGVAVAANMRALLRGSPIVASHADCDRVQDAYSLRCIPQVLGAAVDALAAFERVVAIEINSATDNPLVFPDGRVVSGGNFHGEPLAQFAVLAASALAKTGVMSERRLTSALDPATNQGLPAFLTPRGGVHSGLMIPQYVAASIVSEDQALVTPLPAMSVPTSANQEDVNAMGAGMVQNARRVLDNVATIVGIEAVVAAQALDMRRPLRPAAATGAALTRLRRDVAFLEDDRVLAPDLAKAAALVRDGALLAAAEGRVGPLAPAPGAAARAQRARSRPPTKTRRTGSRPKR